MEALIADVAHTGGLGIVIAYQWWTLKQCKADHAECKADLAKLGDRLDEDRKKLFTMLKEQKK